MLSASMDLSRFHNIILLLVIAGTAVLLISPVSAESGVTISAQGDQSYYLGEEVILNGHNYDSDFTYLFITGPGISPEGGKLSSPLQNITSGDPDSFDRVQTNPDKSWEYTLYTYNSGIDPGRYSLYAASQPQTASQLTGSGNQPVSVIFKKPFITANVSPSSVVRGQPFTIMGFAEGDPDEVVLWIIGDNFVYAASGRTNPDSSFTFDITSDTSGKIPAGPSSLIVQHPMQNVKIDIFPIGDFVKNNVFDGTGQNGTDLFRIKGPGSLQGRDAAEALIAALTDPGVDDTYTEIPFIVNTMDIPPSTPVRLRTTTSRDTPARQQTQASPLLYAPLGALVLVMGICMWSRR